MDNKPFIDLSILQQSEHKFRSLFESMFEGFFIFEVIYDANHQPYDYKYIELNDAAAKLMGFPREHLIGKTLRIILPTVSPVWLNYYSRGASGENLEFEEYSPALNKYFKSIMYAPFPGYLAALSIDITQRVLAENALRISEERLRYSLEAADEGYWDWNLKTGESYFSPRYYTMLGYEPDEFEPGYEAWKRLLPPEEGQNRLAEKSANFCIDNPSTEFQLRTKSGEYKWILSHWKVVSRDEMGVPDRFIGTHADITERKKTQQALLLSEERLRYAMEAADEGYWDWELKSRKIFLSPRYFTMLGYEPNEFEMTMELWFSMLHPDSRKNILQKLSRPESIPDNLTVEFQMHNKAGEFRWILSHWKIFSRNANGSPIRLLGTNSDITERKKIEEALKLNERRISLILDTVPVAFYDIDLSDGFHINWLSNSIERLTGFTPEDFMCDNGFWKSRIHKDDLPQLTEIAKFPVDLYQLEHRWKCADNKFNWFMYRSYLIRDSNGKPMKIMGLMQDISKSKSYEKKLKASEKQARALSTHLENVREEERKTLARDVHDELGQSLTVLKLMAKSIKKDLLNGKSVDPSDLDEMTTLLSSTIKSVQRITTELRPDILDTAGLIAAIEWQVESFSRHSQIECWIDLKDFSSCEFNSCVSTIIFRTVQESLTNISRHAGAKKANVCLKKVENNLVLSIEDNGIGISSKKLKETTSFGLKGMQERAAFAGGKLSIKGRKAKGTTVTLKIPLERALNNYINPKTNKTEYYDKSDDCR
ncbi:MAG: PAS domain-containing protein [Acidobacteriota bacterium]